MVTLVKFILIYVLIWKRLAGLLAYLAESHSEMLVILNAMWNLYMRSWCVKAFKTLAEQLMHSKSCFLICRYCSKEYDRSDKYEGHIRWHAKMARRMI